MREWSSGSGGWMVATGALGTGINIEGIAYVIHVDRPYGLTSFVQQSGRGGRNGEVSESIIIVGMHGMRSRTERLSAYSVEAIDEEAMTAFIQARTCRWKVLSKYLDGSGSGSDCISTYSIYSDRCKTTNGRRPEQQAEDIAQQLRVRQELYDKMIEVMDELHRQCIYCTLALEAQLHAYQ